MAWFVNCGMMYFQVHAIVSVCVCVSVYRKDKLRKLPAIFGLLLRQRQVTCSSRALNLQSPTSKEVGLYCIRIKPLWGRFSAITKKQARGLNYQ